MKQISKEKIMRIKLEKKRLIFAYNTEEYINQNKSYLNYKLEIELLQDVDIKKTTCLNNMYMNE